MLYLCGINPKTMELTYELFRSFLQREGCEEAFDRNFEAFHPGYMMDAGYSRVVGIDCGTFGRVFRWDATPEGRNYWKGIADKWWILITKRTSMSDTN